MTDNTDRIMAFGQSPVPRRRRGRSIRAHADLGAEVIKIETPVRATHLATSAFWKVPGIYFETNNRGVKSLTLNLKSPEGRKILYELVKGADVFGRTSDPARRKRTASDTRISKKPTRASFMSPFPVTVRADHTPRCRVRFHGAGAGASRKLFPLPASVQDGERLRGRRDLRYFDFRGHYGRLYCAV